MVAVALAAMMPVALLVVLVLLELLVKETLVVQDRMLVLVEEAVAQVLSEETGHIQVDI